MADTVGLWVIVTSVKTKDKREMYLFRKCFIPIEQEVYVYRLKY